MIGYMLAEGGLMFVGVLLGHLATVAAQNASKENDERS